MTIDTSRVTATLRGMTAKFDIGVKAAEPFYPSVCNVVKSTGADEKYGFLGAMPGMKEWLDDRDFASLSSGSFTITNRLWEDSIAIEKTDIEDDRLGMYDMLLSQLGDEAACHPDELVFELIESAHEVPCFDGQYFYDTDHAWGDSGTQSNDLTYDGSSTVTEAEFRAAYRQAVTAMLGFKRNNGKPFFRPTIKPITDLMVVVPTALRDVAHDALNKLLISGGETNVVIDRPTIVTAAHLTEARRFHVFRTGQPVKPFVFQNRRPLWRGMKGMEDHEFKDVKFMCDARYNVGYFAWWMAVLTEFT